MTDLGKSYSSCIGLHNFCSSFGELLTSGIKDEKMRLWEWRDIADPAT